nr:GNAT family N-acetyltransferase [Paracraurococcus ruber]
MVAALAAHHGEVAEATPDALGRHLFAPQAAAWLAVLLAEEDGGPLGYAVLFRFFPVQTGETSVILEHLYVAPAVRGRGIGRALLQAAAEQGRAWGCADLRVAARTDNAAAQRFYERQGLQGRPRSGIAYRMPLG